MAPEEVPAPAVFGDLDPKFRIVFEEVHRLIVVVKCGSWICEVFSKMVDDRLTVALRNKKARTKRSKSHLSPSTTAPSPVEEE